MKIEESILILTCLAILMLYIIHKPVNEPFNDFETAGKFIKLKQQIGRPGIDVEKEYLYPIEYRASWEREPERRVQYHDGVWKSIYTTFV